MVNDGAGRVDAAGSGAGVDAFAIDAGLAAGTVRAEQALGSAAGLGVAVVACDTRAGARAVALDAHGVGAARRRLARHRGGRRGRYGETVIRTGRHASGADLYVHAWKKRLRYPPISSATKHKIR